MEIFLTTLNRMAFLFAFMAVGFLLGKLKLVPEGSENILSKLENYLFMPALVMSTFITNFTVDSLSTSWKLLAFCGIIFALGLPVGLILPRALTKDKYLQKIYTYGLCFANFGFMGNAVVEAVFPEFFDEYLVYTLVLQVLIYVWAVPYLLIGHEKKEGENKLLSSLKSIMKPTVLAVFIGAAIGILAIPLPSFVTDAVNSAGSCMSPVAMLLTGMTISHIDIKRVLRTRNIYIASLVRLIIMPIAFGFLFMLFDLTREFYVCMMCAVSMPLGLNTVVIPGAYGKDTTDAAGMALISHVLAVITIPVIFMIFL